jgi:prophage maintenance system killer protein
MPLTSLLVGAEQQLAVDAQQESLVLATLAYLFLTTFLIFSSFMKSTLLSNCTFSQGNKRFAYRIAWPFGLYQQDTTHITPPPSSKH